MFAIKTRVNHFFTSPMKTRKQLLFKILLAALVLFFSQTGISQESSNTVFRSVEARGNLRVVVGHGAESGFQVVSTNYERMALTNSIENGVLLIDYSPRRTRTQRVEVSVTAPVFESLMASGASSIVSDGLIVGGKLTLAATGASSLDLSIDFENVSAKVSGASRAHLNGKANELDVEASGASSVHGFQLESENAKVNISGASSARLHATNHVSGQVVGSSSLRLLERPTTQNVSISGSSSVRMGGTVFRGSYWWDSPFGHSSRKDRFYPSWGGLEIGINGFVAKDGGLNMPEGYEFMTLQQEKSIAVSLNLLTQRIITSGRNFGVYTGVGFGWNNYRFGNNEVLVKGNDGVESTPAIFDNLTKNQLNLTFINVPLMMEYQSSKRRHLSGFNVSAGLNLGIRIRSNTVQKYAMQDITGTRKTTSDFHINPFRLDLQARVGWGWMNFFGSYSLNPLFRDGRGPEIIPFAIGVRLKTGGC